ncbi:MAG: hypothetical protein HC893_00150 [Chloroflexaceae bacterium]|nr:hypothetical protein [Chloroflexaceae bacterium]
MPTPLTPTDQNLLIAYLQSGGNLIASGQNLADVSDIEAFPVDPVMDGRICMATWAHSGPPTMSMRQAPRSSPW